MSPAHRHTTSNSPSLQCDATWHQSMTLNELEHFFVGHKFFSSSVVWQTKKKLLTGGRTDRKEEEKTFIVFYRENYIPGRIFVSQTGRRKKQINFAWLDSKATAYANHPPHRQKQPQTDWKYKHPSTHPMLCNKQKQFQRCFDSRRINKNCMTNSRLFRKEREKEKTHPHTHVL